MYQTQEAGPDAPVSVATAMSRTQEAIGLIVILMASFLLAVDFSILTVALPTIGNDLGFTVGGLQWVITAFALCAAGFTLFFSRLADRLGRRRLFLAGMCLLGAGSLLGGLAANPAMLIGARVLQGVATAISVPTALALITTTFPEGSRRERAIGLNATLMATGFTVGALLSGVITESLGWRWTFLVNLPVVLATVVVTPLVIRATHERSTAQLDLWGSITLSGGLFAVVYGTSTLTAAGWTDIRSGPVIVAGLLILLAFVRIERRAKNPLIPVTLLTRRHIVVANGTGFLAFVTETSFVFLLTLYLQDARGFDSLRTGLCFGLLGVGTIVGGAVGRHTVGRLGNRATVALGFTVQALATLLVGMFGAVMPISMLLLLLLVQGAASLVATVGFVVAATSGLWNAEQGAASGLATTSQQMGIAVGTPLLAAVFTLVLSHSGSPHDAAMSDALSIAIVINACLCVGGVILSGFLDRSRPRAVA
ncbi:MFS transporter [Streptomyces sp. AK02-01A]|uniref:MFS transporter n=1 Tax=Streptomyces sp. AK02-01A TaxID=3028648 RepID=UPI0029AA3E34|nr:MFS transporter [Streptomyces sp. AK02-01A]MDX3853050.1 MFS transporter [Streptomyces sp. AK02-01A]